MRDLTFYTRNVLVLYSIVRHLEELGLKPGNLYTLWVSHEPDVDGGKTPFNLVGTPNTNRIAVYNDGLRGAFHVTKVWGDPNNKVSIEKLLAVNTRQDLFELVDSLDETEDKK